MNIAIVGAGYVGLVTGTCFAETGNDVTCIDVDEARVKDLQSGNIPIYEPELANLLRRNAKEGRLHFTNSLVEGTAKSEIIFLALPTPSEEDGSANLSYILEVADQLGASLDHYTIIIDKSTVPVGTAELVRKRISRNAKVEFDVVSNPEFLREGFAVEDFLKPDRIVIGTQSAKARKILERLYRPYMRQGNPIYFMDEASAEMTKYAANTYLATKISFMNEIANLCELAGANIDAVRLGIGADERIGKRFMFAGIGYGGSCFPKDVKALNYIATENDYDFKILKAVEQVNNRQKHVLVDKVTKYYAGKLAGKKFGLWGLAFKPDTDDIREAPSIEIIDALTSAGATVVAYDPEATENIRKFYGDRNPKLHLVDDAYEALKGVDALLLATEWSEFRTPNFGAMKKVMKRPIVFDGRNTYDIEEMKEQGFYYVSIGREVIEQGS